LLDDGGSGLLGPLITIYGCDLSRRVVKHNEPLLKKFPALVSTTSIAMNLETISPELRQLGAHLAGARSGSGLSQAALAAKCGLAQQQISYFESGIRTPTLEQSLRIARALDVPIQHLLTGADRPGIGLEGLSMELRRLGIVDLWVRDASVPGSFRRPEEVISLALSGAGPDPRIVESIPAVLAWADLDPHLLAGHAIATGTTFRLAWLADIALAIDRQSGFPGGCHRGPLERFLVAAELPGRSAAWDDLGRPAAETPNSPLARRWRIAYDATQDQFRSRAENLHSLRLLKRARQRVLTILKKLPKEVDRADPIADDAPLPPGKPRPKRPTIERSTIKRIASTRRRKRPDGR
jgi:transcriptional regulator with XRE-family HTH domain